MAEYISSLYDNFNDANVQFLQGTQANLNTLMSAGGAIEGAFYLTGDTHRLYVGRKNSSDKKIYPVAVNEGVTTIATLAALQSHHDANIGDFYYVTDKNILAVCASKDTSTGECTWVQLNTDTYLKGKAQDTSAAMSGSDAVISHTISDSSNDMSHDSKGSFTLTPGNANISFEVTADGKVKINVADTKYTLGTEATGSGGTSGVLTITSNDATPVTQKVTFKAGKNVDSIQSDNAGNITFNVADSAIESITTRELGASTPALGDASKKSGFEIDVRAGGLDKYAQLDPVVRIGSTASDKGLGTTAGTFDVKFVDGTAVLNVYTTEQTDKRITEELSNVVRTANAMNYKGVVSGSTAPSLATASIGDTYKCGADINSLPINGGTGSAKTGDLIIVNGADEDADGYVISGYWEVVPSGDDQLLTGNALTHGAMLNDTLEVTKAVVGLQLTAASGDAIEFGTDSWSDSTKINTVTLKHKAYAAKTITGSADVEMDGTNGELAESKTFTAITGFTSDAYGHVTGVTTSTFTVCNTHVKLTSYSYAASAANNVATITSSLGFSDMGSNKDDSFTIGSSTMKVTASGKAVTMNLVWGTF